MFLIYETCLYFWMDNKRQTWNLGGPANLCSTKPSLTNMIHAISWSHSAIHRQFSILLRLFVPQCQDPTQRLWNPFFSGSSEKSVGLQCMTPRKNLKPGSACYSVFVLFGFDLFWTNLSVSQRMFFRGTRIAT